MTAKADNDLSRLGIPRRTSGGRLLSVLIGVVFSAVLGAGAFYAYNRFAGSTPARYQTQAVSRDALAAEVIATGNLRATNTVEVGAEVSGRVLRVLVEPNDTIEIGQVLLELDPDQLQAQVREARANVAVATASLRLSRSTASDAERTANRSRNLQARDLVSQADYESAISANERAVAEVASAAARLSQARAALSSAETNLERSVIHSPIDGVVLTRSAEPGQTVAANFQTPILFELAEDLRRMELPVAVDEADVGKVEAGQHATFSVDAYPDRTFRAEIRRVDLAPETTSGVVTYEAVLDVDNSERLLRPGMTATATIEVDRREDVLIVPNDALRFTPPSQGFGPRRPSPAGSGPQVYVLRDERPVAVPVRILATDGTRTAIEGEGIAEGTQVIVGRESDS